jgi:hypothetical protein
LGGLDARLLGHAQVAPRSVQQPIFLFMVLTLASTRDPAAPSGRLVRAGGSVKIRIRFLRHIWTLGH